MREPRILIVFVRAGVEAYPDAEAHLDALYLAQLPDVRRDVLVVDNLLPPGVHESSPGRTVIGGDNSAWEFSAVDVAVAHVGGAIWQYDLVNVVTSAFEQLYVAYLERFVPPVVSAVVGQRVCLGHIDCYNAPVRIGPFRSQHWLRSCFLLMPVTELKLLGTFVSAAHRTPWFSGNVDDPFGPHSPVDGTYRKYLTDWLLGEDIGQGVAWHRKITLDDAGLHHFEQKARAILNEHLLGVRLRAAGCRLIDMTWLSAQLRAGVMPDWLTPWWSQLGGRDRDAIRLDVGALSHQPLGDGQADEGAGNQSSTCVGSEEESAAAECCGESARVRDSADTPR